ncbi:kinase-like domain-containing protein [Rhypophila decipiens]|uniref:Kinase-like domain-containing protein n=1 Tax=Rhypophila decipiens TaxID=261697 RepID=A0AAN6XSV3_9PEZI|nr:kinase-like domain-containing protein [Rhypophila decipiens]
MSATISSRCLPSPEFATFTESSFFSRNGPDAQLPLPEDVRARSATQSKWTQTGVQPARFQELGLVVKFGRAPRVTVAEGQCLWALRRALPNFPVPEIYGWTHDGGDVFIYMELLHGVTLEERWETLGQTERSSICAQLRVLVTSLRSLQQTPDDESFLGHVNREPLGDIIFTDNETRPPAGPFQSVAEFHDWLSLQIRTGLEVHWPGKQPCEIPDPYRDGLPDDAAVTFTHGDLHPSNIIISVDSPCRIVALIDWRQSGWYPDYWEACKAYYTAEVGGEWMEKYIPLFIDEPACIDAFDDYARAFGY